MFKKKATEIKRAGSDLEYVMIALGIMSDQFCGPAPTDDISFCLRIDLKQKFKDYEVLSILNTAVAQGYCSLEKAGWILTQKGEEMVDTFLGSQTP